jgi:hypothetical protein
MESGELREHDVRPEQMRSGQLEAIEAVELHLFKVEELLQEEVVLLVCASSEEERGALGRVQCTSLPLADGRTLLQRNVAQADGLELLLEARDGLSVSLEAGLGQVLQLVIEPVVANAALTSSRSPHTRAARKGWGNGLNVQSGGDGVLMHDRIPHAGVELPHSGDGFRSVLGRVRLNAQLKRCPHNKKPVSINKLSLLCRHVPTEVPTSLSCFTFISALSINNKGKYKFGQ